MKIPESLKEIFRRCGTPEELAQEVRVWAKREYGTAPFQERVLGIPAKTRSVFQTEKDDEERLCVSFRFKIRKLVQTSPWGGSDTALCLRPTVTVYLSRSPDEEWVLEKATVVPEYKSEGVSEEYDSVVDFRGFEGVSAEEFLFWLLRTQPGWEGEVTAYDDERFLYAGEYRETRVVGFDKFEKLPVWMLP